MARPVLKSISTTGVLHCRSNVPQGVVNYLAYTGPVENIFIDVARYNPDGGTSYVDVLAAIAADVGTTITGATPGTDVGTYLNSRLTDYPLDTQNFTPINTVPREPYADADLLHFESGPNTGTIITPWSVDHRQSGPRAQLISDIVSFAQDRIDTYGLHWLFLDNFDASDPGSNPAAPFPITLADAIDYLDDLSTALHAINVSLIPSMRYPIGNYEHIWNTITDEQMATIATICDAILWEWPCAFAAHDFLYANSSPLTPTAADISEWLRRVNIFATNDCPIVFLGSAAESNQPNTEAGLKYDIHFLAGAAMIVYDAARVSWPHFYAPEAWIDYPATYGAPTGPIVQADTTLKRQFGQYELSVDMVARDVSWQQQTSVPSSSMSSPSAGIRTCSASLGS